MLSTRYRIHTNYANFQEIVERTTGYDINQQTLVEGNVMILNNIFFLEYAFLNVYFTTAKEKDIILLQKKPMYM